MQPMIYIFIGINFLLLFAATISENVTIGDTNDAVNINAPHVIMSMTLLMTLVGIFMTTALMNTAILRDFNHQFDGILFSTPLSKFGYLSGRFLGATLIALLPFVGALAGIFFGSVSPWVDANDVGPFYAGAYWSTFLLGVVPNTFLIAAIVFMLAALFRSSLFSFIGSIGMLVFYVMMLSFASNLESESISILSDPLAINSYDLLTKYWTVEEKNTQWLSFTGPMMWNRILWLGMSFVFLVLTFFRFSFSKRTSIFQRKVKVVKNTETQKYLVIGQLKALPTVQLQDNASMTWKQLLHQTSVEFWGVVSSTPFIVLLVLGLVNMFTAIPRAADWYGTGNHPVTYLIVETVRGSLYLFLIGILMYYSGAIIWREREAKMNEFFDAAPFATWIPFVSKLIGMIALTGIVLSLAIACGITYQLFSGYQNIELSVYLREFLVYDLLSFTILIVLSMLLQVLVNNKYLAYFFFILLLVIFNFGSRALEIESNLMIFGSVPSYTYSDMNGWNLYAAGLSWFYTYWSLFAGFLGMLSILFWVRGQALTWKQRWNIARQRFQGKVAMTVIALLVLWLGTGSFLFYQTKIVNTITDRAVEEQRQIDYEQKYKQYQHIAQPRITTIDFDISIYPEDRHFLAKANLVAKNKTNESIEQIHFTIPRDLKITIAIPNAEIIVDDESLNYQIYQLEEPLEAGASLAFEVSVIYDKSGIENEVSNTDIVENGTFLSNFKLIPNIGYNTDRELESKKERAEAGLPERPRQEKLHTNCSHVCQNTYISSDSDWVNVSSVISTANDQVAIAPGTLVKEWNSDGRRFFKYELKKPVLNFYSFISGRYEIARDIWTGPNGEKVDVEIYHHPNHAYNVDKMIGSLKRSLTYYSNNYLPYPHEQARIIEFPRYQNFAQAFPGTMPYSESMGFIANLNESDAIDMVYYVVAHEMAHQWWAHQVIGANTQGATMLSESFSQYGALMVMQQEYGKDKMKQFLRYEMDRYLRNRGAENVKELPLMYNDGQPYIHYRKGSVVMYALQDYIGEDQLNLALRRYAKAVAYQEAPYTTTLEVMDYFAEVTPDSLHYLLDDMFRNITLYSNKTTTATYKTLADGRYEVNVEVNIEKYRADSLGKETLIPHHDFIDIGIYSKDKNEGERYGRPILVERHLIQSPDTNFTFIVDEQPFEAGIDPNYLLVDRFPEDNLKELVEID